MKRVKFKSIFLISILLTALSCRYEPIGTEVTINRLINLYSNGEIKKFHFIEKGSWVTGQLTKDAINSEKYSELINEMINKNMISSKSEFRFMAKVISLESFREQLKEATGESIEIKILKDK